MAEESDREWEAATWKGSRRLQLRRALALTPRERLEAMVEACETARHLASASDPDPASRIKKGDQL